jgi:hypothetical protein
MFSSPLGLRGVEIPPPRIEREWNDDGLVQLGIGSCRARRATTPARGMRSQAAGWCQLVAAYIGEQVSAIVGLRSGSTLADARAAFPRPRCLTPRLPLCAPSGYSTQSFASHAHSINLVCGHPRHSPHRPER